MQEDTWSIPNPGYERDPDKVQENLDTIVEKANAIPATSGSLTMAVSTPSGGFPAGSSGSRTSTFTESFLAGVIVDPPCIIMVGLQVNTASTGSGATLTLGPQTVTVGGNPVDPTAFYWDTGYGDVAQSYSWSGRSGTLNLDQFIISIPV